MAKASKRAQVAGSRNPVAAQLWRANKPGIVPDKRAKAKALAAQRQLRGSDHHAA
jgi:hypothetical protein